METQALLHGTGNGSSWMVIIPVVFILVVSNLQYLYRKRVIQGVGHMNRGYKPLAKCDDHPDLTSTFNTLGRTIRVREVRQCSFRVWMILLFFISNPSTSKSFCWNGKGGNLLGKDGIFIAARSGPCGD